VKRLLSLLSGMLRTYLVDVGAQVKHDTEVALVESMKMEIPVLAGFGGRVTALLADPSSMIEEGQPLLEIGV
jgi:acetyl-CoA carboxylase biotin carboxyl carrier protein